MGCTLSPRAIDLLPQRALSLKGPWWWFMLHLPPEHRKPIENRPQGFSHKSFRGECWVHATKPTRGEYNHAMEFALRFGRVPPDVLFASVPAWKELPAGGIVGRWCVTGVLPVPGGGELLPWPNLQTPCWRMRENFAFTVEDATPVPFVACAGSLGFWRVPQGVLRQLAGERP